MAHRPSGKWFLSAAALVVLAATLAVVQAAGPSSGGHQRSSKMKPPPIVSEESSSKNRRTSDCHFGKKVYELEERWNPDLGSPFGVMYCIRCECIAQQSSGEAVQHCSEHGEQTQSYYCNTCRLGACHLCVLSDVGRHHNHDVHLLALICKQQKRPVIIIIRLFFSSLSARPAHRC